VNKAGVLLSSKGNATISVGALPNQQSDSEPDRAMTLDELVSSDLQGINIGMTPAPENVKVIRKQETMFLNVPAVKTEVTYTQGGVEKVEETIYVIRSGAVYQFQLRCPVRDRRLSEDDFRSITEAFRWSCDQNQR
jgi:hypothetical protein